MVARRKPEANVGSLEKILDREKLHARVKAVATAGTLSPGENGAVQEFLEAWKKLERKESEDARHPE
jgi:hypothetical protein